MIIKSGKKFGARVYDPETRKQVWLGTRETKREAQQLERDWLSGRRAKGSATVDDLAERWLTEGAIQKHWRTATAKHNTERIRHYRQANGHRKASEVRVSEALTWATQYPREIPALRAMFAFGRLIEAVESNPFAGLGVGKPKALRARRALTEDEVTHLAGTAGRMFGPWLESLITFSAYTGLRAGETFALTFADLGHDELTIRRSYSSATGETTLPKNGKERTVIFPPPAREAVSRMPRRVDQEFVFVNPRDGKRLTSQSLGYWWRQARAAAGFPDLVWHELRHTALTILLERGASADDVAHQAGHADASLIYSTYGHPSEDRTRARLKALFAPNVASLAVVRESERKESSA